MVHVPESLSNCTSARGITMSPQNIHKYTAGTAFHFKILYLNYILFFINLFTVETIIFAALCGKISSKMVQRFEQ